MSPLQGQHVLILGLGASGLAMARWCVRQGARVTVADTREAPPQLARLQRELPQADFRAGAFEAGLVEGQDVRAVFKSPGLSPADGGAGLAGGAGHRPVRWAASWTCLHARCATCRPNAAMPPRCWRSPAPTARPP